MKIHLVTKLARQVDGDLVFVQCLQAFSSKDKLKEFVNNTTYSPTEKINGIDCMIEIGIIEDVELDNQEANVPTSPV